MIYNFSGIYDFLSNFYECKVEYNGLEYKSVEHAYQSNKAINKSEHDWIMNAPTASKAKNFASKIKIREDWEEIKYDLMKKLVSFKFKNNEDLRNKLLKTGDEFLIEGNYWHDNIWGNCTCNKCKNIRGTNWLGQILMDVRKKLKEELEFLN